MSPVLFPVVADPVPWNSDEFLSRLPSELRVSFPPCFPYAEVARVLVVLNCPIGCWKGKTIVTLLKSQFPLVDGLEDPSIVGDLVTPAASEVVQIINTG